MLELFLRYSVLYKACGGIFSVCRRNALTTAVLATFEVLNTSGFTFENTAASQVRRKLVNA